MGLEVPAPILAALQAHIAVIEDIAQQENIYLPPQKRLDFVEPNSSVFDTGADFIPLRCVESEKQFHSVTNIPFWDDDVIFVDKVPAPDKNKKTLEHNVTVDTSNAKKHETDRKAFISEDVILLDDTDIIQSKIKVKKEFIDGENDIKRVKIEDVEPVPVEQVKIEDVRPIPVEQVKIEYVKTVAVELVKIEDVKPVVVEQVKVEDVKPVAVEDIKPVKIEGVEPITIDDDEASQSEPGSFRHDWRYNHDYKYGYDDIITGTFQEKLDECIAKGIAIQTKNSETALLNPALLEEYNFMKEDPQYKNMLKFRETLPAYKKAEHLLQVVNENQVVVISGETGCGKSTQVMKSVY